MSKQRASQDDVVRLTMPESESSTKLNSRREFGDLRKKREHEDADMSVDDENIEHQQQGVSILCCTLCSLMAYLLAVAGTIMLLRLLPPEQLTWLPEYDPPRYRTFDINFNSTTHTLPFEKGLKIGDAIEIKFKFARPPNDVYPSIALSYEDFISPFTMTLIPDAKLGGYIIINSIYDATKQGTFLMFQEKTLDELFKAG